MLRLKNRVREAFRAAQLVRDNIFEDPSKAKVKKAARYGDGEEEHFDDGEEEHYDGEEELGSGSDENNDEDGEEENGEEEAGEEEHAASDDDGGEEHDEKNRTKKLPIVKPTGIKDPYVQRCHFISRFTPNNVVVHGSSKSCSAVIIDLVTRSRTRYPVQATGNYVTKYARYLNLHIYLSDDRICIWKEGENTFTEVGIITMSLFETNRSALASMLHLADKYLYFIDYDMKPRRIDLTSPDLEAKEVISLDEFEANSLFFFRGNLFLADSDGNLMRVSKSKAEVEKKVKVTTKKKEQNTSILTAAGKNLACCFSDVTESKRIDTTYSLISLIQPSTLKKLSSVVIEVPQQREDRQWCHDNIQSLVYTTVNNAKLLIFALLYYQFGAILIRRSKLYKVFRSEEIGSYTKINFLYVDHKRHQILLSFEKKKPTIYSFVLKL